MAQSVKCPTSTQVMISPFVSLSPASSSVLPAQSLEPASDSVSLSLLPTHPPPHPPALWHSLSLKNKHLKIFLIKVMRHAKQLILGLT